MARDKKSFFENIDIFKTCPNLFYIQNRDAISSKVSKTFSIIFIIVALSTFGDYIYDRLNHNTFRNYKEEDIVNVKKDIGINK